MTHRAHAASHNIERILPVLFSLKFWIHKVYLKGKKIFGKRNKTFLPRCLLGSWCHPARETVQWSEFTAVVNSLQNCWTGRVVYVQFTTQLLNWMCSVRVMTPCLKVFEMVSPRLLLTGERLTHLFFYLSFVCLVKHSSWCFTVSCFVSPMER